MTDKSFFTDDPAPGTERLHVVKCIICGAAHMSRTRLCDTCREKSIEIGMAVLLLQTKEGVNEMIIDEIKIERLK